MGNAASRKKEYKIEQTVDFVEEFVCGDDELSDGQMREFELGQGKILLVKQDGAYSALSTKCTHYGAPLVKGVLKDGKIRCPWHGACFNSKTGDIEDFPGLDCLSSFDVKVKDGQVKVRAQLSALKSQKRSKSIPKCFAPTEETFVVVGGGPAAQSCVETLRHNGFAGKLIMITKEKHYPYDRPKLSKALDATAESLYLRPPDYYKTSIITMMQEMEVTRVDTDEKWVSCDNDKLLVKYDALMIATGGSPIPLGIPGSDLKNVFLLRTPEDGQQIAKNCIGKAVVLVGSSFIAMEVASYMLMKARSINVISRGDVPFRFVFGEDIGKRIQKMFEEKGVIFHTESEVNKFVGTNGTLTSVELKSGTELHADICIIGIGVRPSTDFLKSSKINLNEKNLVCVDEFLETNISNVFACGDIIEFPLAVMNNQKVNISHYQMAMAHGRTAALNMLGKQHVFRSVPFFWCVMCGKSFRYAGYGVGFDDIIINGSIEDLEFAAYYCKDDKVVAICTVNKDPEAALFASHMLSGKVFQKCDVKDGLPA